MVSIMSHSSRINMKVKLFTLSFLMFFILPVGMNGQELCDDCALQIVEDSQHNNCCNKCLFTNSLIHYHPVAPHPFLTSPYNRIPAHCTLYIVNCTFSRGAAPSFRRSRNLRPLRTHALSSPFILRASFSILLWVLPDQG